MCVKKDRYVVIIITRAWFEEFPVDTKLIIIIVSDKKFFDNACVSKIVELKSSLKLVVDIVIIIILYSYCI
jgi:hypothetical protein